MTREEFEQARALGIEMFEVVGTEYVVEFLYECNKGLMVGHDNERVLMQIKQLKPVYDKPDVICRKLLDTMVGQVTKADAGKNAI